MNFILFRKNYQPSVRTMGICGVLACCHPPLSAQLWDKSVLLGWGRLGKPWSLTDRGRQTWLGAEHGKTHFQGYCQKQCQFQWWTIMGGQWYSYPEVTVLTGVVRRRVEPLTFNGKIQRRLLQIPGGWEATCTYEDAHTRRRDSLRHLLLPWSNVRPWTYRGSLGGKKH